MPFAVWQYSPAAEVHQATAAAQIIEITADTAKITGTLQEMPGINTNKTEREKMKKKIKSISVALILGMVSMLLVGCKDYCSYGGCMREAEIGGRCSVHQGLPDDPYYGIPD